MVKSSKKIIPLIGIFSPFVLTAYSLTNPFIDRKYPFIAFKKKNSSGFTLIELMVTLVVAAVLITVAVPAIRTVIQNSRLTAQANNLLADISSARSEAIKRGVNITICRSTNPTATPPSCSNTSTDWSSGWVVYQDANNNGVIDSAETILRVQEALEGSNTLNTVRIVPPVPPATTSTVSSLFSFVYTRNGQTTLPTTSRVEMRLCDSRGVSRGKLVTVNFIGRANASSPPSSCGTT